MKDQHTPVMQSQNVNGNRKKKRRGHVRKNTLGTLAHKSAEYKKGILGINLENISSIVD